ncbi:MAG: hypothetical protein RL283_1366 [Actinomycetota bacterium]
MTTHLAAAPAFVPHDHPFTPFDEEPPADAAAFRALPPPDEMLPPAPAEGSEFRHRVGVRPLDASRWLPRDAETAPTIAMKRRLVAGRRDEVVAALDDGRAAALGLAPGLVAAAAEEAGRLVAEWCGAPTASTGLDALVDAALLTADDLTVLAPTPTGGLVFVAGVVCAPSRWRLADKIGHDMLTVHAPVARYGDHIGGAVDTLLDRLSAERPVWRSNWTLEDHPALFQPAVPRAPLGREPADLWIRMERETLRRLPRTGGVLFTIRGFQQPLRDYVARGPEVARTLRALVARLPEDVARYKSVFAYRDAVLAWLDSLAA